MENATDKKELADKMLDLIENPPAIAKLDGIAKKLEMQYKKENCAERIVSRKNLTEIVLCIM